MNNLKNKKFKNRSPSSINTKTIWKMWIVQRSFFFVHTDELFGKYGLSKEIF